MKTQLLEIAITAGSHAGQRVRINRSPAAFGRDAENPLVIDLPTVSRVHGELRYDEYQWVLANLSPNGTQLNRRNVGGKPRPLRDGDQIVVGDQPILVVSLRETEGQSVVASSESSASSSNASPPKTGINPRIKLWLSILGFWMVIFTIAFIFTGLDTDETAAGPSVPMLTDSQIAASIRQHLPRQEPSPRTAGEFFDEAESYYQMINADPRNTFRAYQAYKTALSYAFGETFTDERDNWGGKPTAELAIAQKRYNELEQSLINDVQRLYTNAYEKLRERRYSDARIGFERVYKLYNDAESEIYRNAQRQRDVARQRQDR